MGEFDFPCIALTSRWRKLIAGGTGGMVKAITSRDAAAVNGRACVKNIEP